MKILLVGDNHIYGYGLSVGQLSYPSHFIHRLSRTGRSVCIEAYPQPALSEMPAMLARLPLNQYDLIVLQLSSDIIERVIPGSGPERLVTSPLMPMIGKPIGVGKETAGLGGMLKRVKSTGKTGFDMVASIFSTVSCPGRLGQLLAILRPYRHTVVLMTPFPSLTLLEQWKRERSRSVLVEVGINQGFSVFDSKRIIKPRDEYFLRGDDEHLNAVSHELIGRALFDFYQSAPTIVTVQTINRKLID